MLNTFVSGVILTVTELSMQIRYSVLEWFFLMYDDITIFYNSGKNMIYCFWILSTFGVVSLVVLGFFVYVYGTKMSGSLYLNPFRKKKN